MKLSLGTKAVARNSKNSLDVLFKSEQIQLEKGRFHQVTQFKSGDSHFFLFGVIHAVNTGGLYEKINHRSNDSQNNLLSKVFGNLPLEKAIISCEGHFMGVQITSNQELTLFGDSCGRIEVFYVEQDGEIVATESLDRLVTEERSKGYDQTALINLLGIYGNYAPKQQTIYKGIKRLGVGQRIIFSNGKVSYENESFTPEKTQEYGNEKLEEYYEIFRSAVEIRSSDEMNWVCMSSGWDSSSILAMLNHIHGPKKIRCAIMRMQYSDRSGYNNDFEIKRAKQITDFYDVPLDIVDVNYSSPEFNDFWSSIRNDFKAQHIYGLYPYNFYKLNNYISKHATPRSSVFNGETSDGSHNFGFSQFATILDHPDLGFREYSDKMASYLFGPSFFESIQNGKAKDDLIYKLLADQKGDGHIDIEKMSKKDNWKIDYALSFLCSAKRLPFSELGNTGMLTDRGMEKYRNEIGESYLKEFNDTATSENIYSWFAHLYNSFYWQGSNIKGVMTSPGYNDLSVAAPFWDNRMQSFLSVMPESWGRGLELHPTKYPLKWMLRNKIKYPLDLQVGPHSYLYDVNPNWSADADIIYGSEAVPFFKERLKSKSYEELFDPEVFDLGKISKLTDEYVKGKEVVGQDRADLKNLISLCNVGWY
ncbi:MAG: hypothetical protein HN576_09435 [Bacteriovoracaceae bacterium]|jgi:hypothetical protein|nr:hypothetical protein [Bacteriovoracaceae bacterium]